MVSSRDGCWVSSLMSLLFVVVFAFLFLLLFCLFARFCSRYMVSVFVSFWCIVFGLVATRFTFVLFLVFVFVCSLSFSVHLFPSLVLSPFLVSCFLCFFVRFSSSCVLFFFLFSLLFFVLFALFAFLCCLFLLLLFSGAVGETLTKSQRRRVMQKWHFVPP